MRVSAKLTQEIITFDSIEEMVSFLMDGHGTVRALIGDELYQIVVLSNDYEQGIANLYCYHFDMGQAWNDDDGRPFSAIADEFDICDAIGIELHGETDGDYSMFGINI